MSRIHCHYECFLEARPNEVIYTIPSICNEGRMIPKNSSTGECIMHGLHGLAPFFAPEENDLPEPAGWVNSRDRREDITPLDLAEKGSELFEMLERASEDRKKGKFIRTTIKRSSMVSP